MLSFSALDLYASCFYVRFVENLLSDAYVDGNIRTPMHLSIGQELVPGVVAQLSSKDDLAVSSHRSHGHYLGKGGCLSSFFDELHGLSSGCSKGRGGSMHLIDQNVGFMGSTAIVGNTIPVGVGLAQSLQLQGSSNVVFVFLGDAATEEGVFYESLHYASLYSLPVIFLIENNSYSVYTNLNTRQGQITLSEKLKGFNVQYSFNDNHDYKLLFEQLCCALSSCRSGHGPVCLEVMTFRYLEHCGPSNDDTLKYRPSGYIEKWKSLDILAMLKSDILGSNLSTSSKLQSLEDEISSDCRLKFSESRFRRETLFNL